MAAQSITTPDSKRSGVSRVFSWLLGIVSFGILAYLLVQVAYQIAVPPPAHRLLFTQDIPLPSGLGATSPGQTNRLAPGVEQQFDHFDFQAYDAATHQLFISHAGPNPDLLTLAHMKFDPKYDGHIIVFNTLQNKVSNRIDIPQVAGVVDAPDLGRVYAGDAQDNIVYSIDVHTLKYTPIQLDDNESPDAIAYDPDDHEIFVSDPGAPADPNKTLNADPNNEDVTVISTITNKVITKINLGNLPLAPGEKAPLNAHRLPLYGHDVGHNKYDPGLHRVFVTSQILPNGDDPNPYLLPPPGTGEFFSIDPVQHKILQELVLPASCSTPHGLDIDSTQEIGFVACTDLDSSRGLVSNLLRVNLRTMTVIPADPMKERLANAPDIVMLDTAYHVLFVACKGGISIFDEKTGEFHKLGDYLLGKQTHTIAINEQTQEIYLPQFAGGRPILRIGKYNPSGV
jgi:DNA-binding beta-propeller fold protein YncE